MNLRFKNFILGVSLLAAFILPSTRAEAVLASVKSLGMAATAIAYPQDSLCIAYNPAGLVWVGDRIDGEAGWLRNTARLRVSGNANPEFNGSFNAMRTKDFYFAGGGFSKSYCCECFQWSVGFAVYNRNFQKTTYGRSHPLVGTSHIGLEFVNETIAPTLAVLLFDDHSFGITFNWQIERLKVNGVENFDNEALSRSPGNVTNRGYAYSHGFMPTFGYRWQVTECIAIGATYQPKTHMSKFKKYKGFAVDGRIDVPEKWGMGISVDILPCWTACFDAELVRWSGARSLHNNFIIPTTDDTKLGAKNGTGFGFRDQWFFRVGLEYRLSESLALRAGFRHAKALPRRTQTAVNLLTQDCVEDFMTVGATWNINCCSEISAAFAYGFEKKIKGRDSIPALLGGGNVDLKERKYALGLAYGWKY